MLLTSMEGGGKCATTIRIYTLLKKQISKSARLFLSLVM